MKGKVHKEVMIVSHRIMDRSSTLWSFVSGLAQVKVKTMQRCMRRNGICYNLNDSGAKQNKMQNLRIIAIFHPFVQESSPFIILLQSSLFIFLFLVEKEEKVKRDPVLGHQRTWMSLRKEFLRLFAIDAKKEEFSAWNITTNKKLHFLKITYFRATWTFFCHRN